MRAVAVALVFAVCIVAAVALHLGTRWTTRLAPRTLLALTALALALYAALLAIRPASVALADLAVFAVALLTGSALGRLVNARAALVPMCIAAAVADIASFEFGATGRLIRSFERGTSNLLQYLCLSLPLRGHTIPVVGIGDLLILTALYAGMRRLGYRGLPALLAPLAGLLLAVVVGLFAGAIFAIPFIAATTIAYLWWADRRAHRQIAG